ncbi:amidase domain-containing protein [Paenibacillus sp. GCM10012307]|uniref:Amidase domain-containing protein n=1 Tax=Paenibacillus roseus TaxID=2798579 RepID=A0A934J9G3_9BACL|nr:amidase domain-containing protein [Paenibacillus roseus]MBJ6362795.1 amidase domain-containing protein [Paenibacillus roseus]
MAHSPRVKRSPQQLSGWKATINEYVRLLNQAEIEHAGLPLKEAAADQEHLQRLDKRLARTADRDRQRLAASVKHEARASLIRVQEFGNEASMLLRCEHTRTLNQQGSVYVEERRDYERIWLQHDGSRWQITRIEPVVAERRPRFGGAGLSLRQDEPFFPAKAPGLPYLNHNLLRNFSHESARGLYHRDLAVAYADRWWDTANPEYEEFEVNCTNYISQCLFAGRVPMDYTGRRGTGWWYKGRDNGNEWWSYSWAVSNALQSFLAGRRTTGLRAIAVNAPDQLKLGDVIVYDWNGDGRFQHSTIVTAFDVDGMPLVNANTVSSRHRYWDYRDSYAWTEQTQYRFFHIADEL